MDLIDLIPIWVALLSLLLGGLWIMLLLRFRVIHSVADPCVLVLFQLLFTFFILLFIRQLLIVDAIGFLIFIGLIVQFRSSGGSKDKPVISQEDWIAFSKIFVIVLLILNVYLVKEKGFLLLSSDVGNARVGFYQGWGIFKRFNEVGIGLTSITAAILWHRGQRKQAGAIALFSAYLALTLGSRGGLIACLLAYGAYLHFSKIRISNKRILLAGGALGLSSLAIFFIMFGPQFLGAFAYRVMAFSDGPVYYFSDQMYRYSDYPVTYPFEDLLVDLRLEPYYENPPSNRPLPLGRFINMHHFGQDTPLLGPNPQIFIESHAAFHWLSIFWYILAGALFSLLRKQSTPYSFYLGCSIAGPFLVDSQYSGSQLFSVMLLLPMVGAFLCIRYVLRQACAGVSKRTVEA